MNFKKLLINTIIIFLLCSLIHFGYTLFPNTLTSIFCPVNESIWEHLKMIFTASFIFSILTRLVYYKDHNFLIKTFLRGIITNIILLIIYLPIYYIIGEKLILTMILLFISIFISEYIISKLSIEKHQYNLIGAITIIITYLIFTYLTYNPLKIDLFYDHNANKYGIDILNK